MRLTLVAYDDSPPLGGQGVVVQGMRAELQRRGVQVHTISGRGEHAIAYPRLLRRAPLDLSLHLNRDPARLLRESLDVLHAHGGPGGVILLRRLPVPLVYTAHHTYTQAHGRGSARRFLAPFEARGYREAARVLAVSESTAAAVRAMDVPASRIEVLPPGVDVPARSDDAHEPARVLFLGRLEPDKGVLDAVQVMRLLVQQLPGGRGVIVGGGSLSRTVRERVASESRIEVLGPLPPEQAALQYARASLLLMPSRYEGLGLAALEAQAHGTPVAGYDVDGLRHAVREGGVLVPAGRVDLLREAALGLLRDPVRAAELGARGREMVHREHSWARVGERLLQVYEAVTEGAAQVAP